MSSSTVSASHDPSAESIRALLQLLDVALRALEDTAWRTRKAWNAGTKTMGEEWAELRVLPSRWSRLGSTGLALGKIASSYRLHLTASAFVTRRAAARMLERRHHKNAARFRQASETHGGAFLKVGQMLSARPDLMPVAWIEELAGLQDAAPAEEFSHVQTVIESELGAPLLELFERFDETPLAAASIGQVHRARTHDGVEVAVKVQRPNIDELIEADLDVMERFIEGLRPTLPPTDLDTVVREIREGVQSELDYDAEAAHMSATSAFLETVEGVRAPLPVAESCTARVLTATFEKGRKITDVLDELAEARTAGDPKAEPRLSLLLGQLLECYARQVLLARRFQADPHPGNLLVDENDEIIVLDFGCTQELTVQTRDRYVALMLAFFSRDKSRIVELLGQLGIETQSGSPESLLPFAEVLLTELRNAAEGNHQWRTKEELIQEMKSLGSSAERDPVIRLPGGLIMLARVFGTLGGLFMHYRPELDVTRHLLPVLVEASAKVDPTGIHLNQPSS